MKRLVLASALLSGACTATPHTTSGPEEIRRVHVGELRPEQVEETIPVFGTLVPRQEIRVSAPSSGTVAGIEVEEGATASRGVLLVRIQNEQISARRRQVSGEVSAAAHAVQLAKARIDATRRNILQRVTRLGGLAHATELERIEYERAAERLRQADQRLESGGISPEEHASFAHASSTAELHLRIAENEQAVLAAELGADTQAGALDVASRMYVEEILSHNLHMVRAQLASEEARLRVAVAEQDAVVDLHESLSVRAPGNGRIARVHVESGERVEPGTLLLTLHGTSTPDLNVRLHESGLQQIRIGSRVAVTIPAVSAELRSAEVRRIGVAADPRSGSVSVLIRLHGTAAELRPGMYAEASIHAERARSGIHIPASAMREHEADRASVWVLAADRVFPREISVSEARRDGSYRLLSGLEEGEIIVLENHSGLRPGEHVHAVFETEED
ncbi:MAG: efflux RND transporter periplasmic adaptor subunit [Spirochaetaceae bacterium]